MIARTRLIAWIIALATLVVAPVATPQAPAPAEFTPEREAAARTFARRHHPELDALLDRLKPMNPVEYEKAIAALFKDSEALAAIQAKDARRYDLALEAWKAGSRVRLLAAQLAGRREPDAEMTSAVREALSAQADAEIRQRRLDREAMASRLKKLDDQIERLERERDRKVEARYQNLLKKGAAARAVSGKAAAKIPNNVHATPTPTKGDRK